MKNILAYLLLFIGFMITTSCTASSGQDGDLFPGINVPEKNINSKIVLQNFPGEPQSYKVGDSLAFGIINQSVYNITFHNDFDVKIFIKQDEVWEPINNKVEYPEGERILPTKKIDPTGLVLFVLPDLGEIKSSTIVRIVVIGQVKDKSEQVGAYIDVHYAP